MTKPDSWRSQWLLPPQKDEEFDESEETFTSLPQQEETDLISTSYGSPSQFPLPADGGTASLLDPVAPPFGFEYEGRPKARPEAEALPEPVDNLTISEVDARCDKIEKVVQDLSEQTDEQLSFVHHCMIEQIKETDEALKQERTNIVDLCREIWN